MSLLGYLSNAGWVKRFHVVPTVFQDTVGRHSWGVAALLWILTAGRVSARLLGAALLHDLAELDWGDMPSPVKRTLRGSRRRGALTRLEEETYRALPQLVPPPLNAEERRLLKLADVFEGMLYCCAERAAGNCGSIRWVYVNYYSYAAPLLETEAEWALFQQITGLWKKEPRI